MYNNYFNPGYGYAIQQAQQDTPIFNQLLTADEVAKLQKNPNFFSTKLTEDEYLRAVCTHKDNQGRISLEKLPNGKHRCSICQAEFFLIDLNTAPEDIEQTCNNFYDLLQTIKTYYGNAPAALRDFYLMVGFIPKMKYLWNVARAYFDKATGGQGTLTANNDQNGFAILNSIFGNGAISGIAPQLMGQTPNQFFNNGYYPQAGYYGGPVPQAAMMQTPQANPQMMQQQYPQQQMVQPQVMPQQQPMYGYGYNQQYINQPPQQQQMYPQGSNPIGYVEQNQAGQPSQTQTPPMPQAPQNPNIKKADVGKKFDG